MSICLYELATAEDRRFSPYCWRVRLALAHKGLEFRTVGLSYGEIRSGKAGAPAVPVLHEDEVRLPESFEIAEYLDKRWPDKPTLFDSPGAKAISRFLDSWSFFVLNRAILRTVAPEIYVQIAPEDQETFRTTREERLGARFADLARDRETHEQAVVSLLQPAEKTLSGQPFLCGERPGYGDYILFGSLMFPHVLAPWPCMKALPATASWFRQIATRHDDVVGKSARELPHLEALSHVFAHHPRSDV